MAEKKFSKLVEKAVENGFSGWWRYALSRTWRREDADEVVQDALFRTLRAKPDVQSEEEAGRYIWTVLRTTSVPTVGAARGRAQTSELVEERLPATDRTVGRSPLDALIAAERSDALTQTFERVMEEFQHLPAELQQAIELHVLREPPMRLREIAEIQGVAISTAHDRVNRGLRELARVIAAPPFEDE